MTGKTCHHRQFPNPIQSDLESINFLTIKKRMWSGYLATVTYMDEQIGRILQSLKELGLEKETAVIFTSDHGYLLGEHHFWQKET